MYTWFVVIYTYTFTPFPTFRPERFDLVLFMAGEQFEWNDMSLVTLNLTCVSPEGKTIMRA